MNEADHENYARELLAALPDHSPEIEPLGFAPDPNKTRNAASAMTAIICYRLFKNSREKPILQEYTNYEWNSGIFNCRNISDRDKMWTNIRTNLADELHRFALTTRVVYLLAFSSPGSRTLCVWAIPEPLVRLSLQNLPAKKGNQAYSIEISRDDHRIKNFAMSPDLTSYFRELPLSQDELLALNRSREIDSLAKLEKDKTKREIDEQARLLADAGEFDPSGLDDARKRVLSSIARRSGQPAFRRKLLMAYKRRCAISECDVEYALEAAHIIPYRGPKTNHPKNGLLLRADLHTLFDLRLIAIDSSAMQLLISPSLFGTCYEELLGRKISTPDDPQKGPSKKALDDHRKESGL